MKEVEDETKHCRAQPVAQATHASDHALHKALLVWLSMGGHK